jgi:hypothetical protein
MHGKEAGSWPSLPTVKGGLNFIPLGMMRRLTTVLYLTAVTGWAQDPATSIVKYPRWKAEACLDFVRTMQAGVSYSPVSAVELSVKLAVVYPNGILSNSVQANDYFYFTGVGAGAGIFWRPGKKRHLYLGFSNSIYEYGYSQKWTEQSLDYDKYGARYLSPQLRDRKVASVVIMAPVIGYSVRVGRVLCGGYLLFGGEQTKNRVTVYDASSPPVPAYTYTRSLNQPHVQIAVNAAYGFQFRETRAFSFYKKLLRDRTKSNRLTIDALYAQGRISKEVYFKEYLQRLPSQLATLKKMYRKKQDAPAAMLEFTEKLIQEAIAYYEQVIRSAN